MRKKRSTNQKVEELGCIVDGCTIARKVRLGTDNHGGKNTHIVVKSQHQHEDIINQSMTDLPEEHGIFLSITWALQFYALRNAFLEELWWLNR